MADDTFRRRRRNAAAAAIARRAELGLTQEELATKAGVAPRTVTYFEAGRWPNPHTRARIERALGWPSGEISRLAGPPRPFIDPQLLDRVSELPRDEREWMIRWLQAHLDQEQPPDDQWRARGSP